MRTLTEQDIEALAVGAAILGTGGGGNPYVGKLHCLQELRRGATVQLVGIDELADDAVVMPVGGIGADNMKGWRDAGAAGFGLGSSLYKPGDNAATVAEKAAAIFAAWKALA